MTRTSELPHALASLLSWSLRTGSSPTPYTSYINSFPKSVYVVNVSVAGVRPVSNDVNNFKARARQEDNLGSTLKKTECWVSGTCVHSDQSNSENHPPLALSSAADCGHRSTERGKESIRGTVWRKEQYGTGNGVHMLWGTECLELLEKINCSESSLLWLG